VPNAGRGHAEPRQLLGILKRSEGKAIDGFADMLDHIAEALTEAVREKDPAALGRIWWFTKMAVAPVLVVGGTVADSLSIVDHFASSETVLEIAHEIVQRADTEMPYVLSWDQPSPHPSWTCPKAQLRHRSVR